jgi:uncharacterized membrane protein YdjX (TVP38/TMEM64 family)
MDIGTVHALIYTVIGWIIGQIIYFAILRKPLLNWLGKRKSRRS